MHKPYLLTPCGHLACHNCLVRWFTEPRDGGGNTVPPGLDNPLPGTTGNYSNISVSYSHFAHGNVIQNRTLHRPILHRRADWITSDDRRHVPIVELASSLGP